MINLILGPMWSGKTYKNAQLVYESINKGQSVIIHEAINPRRSERDLSRMIQPHELVKFDIKVPSNIVIFDEVHLYEVFSKEDMFWDLFLYADEMAQNIYISGVHLNCYTNYKPFEIFYRLLRYCDNIQMLNCRKPCAVCGGTKRVIYTRNVKPVTGLSDRIGDHYEVICERCV